MNGKELMVLGFFGCASLIVLWLRHSQKKIKLSFWKVCLLGLGCLIVLAIYLNRLAIKSYVAYESSIKKVEKAEETIRNSQREKLFEELEKIEKENDPKFLERIKEIKNELANLNPQPPQPEKRERIVREGVFKILANEIVNTISVTPADVDEGISCILIQQGKPQVYWLVNGSGNDIKITDQYDCIRINKWGTLRLKGGKKATTVKVQIMYIKQKI